MLRLVQRILRKGTRNSRPARALLIEPLEPRQLLSDTAAPTATLLASTLTAGGDPTYAFQVVYKDSGGSVKVSSLDSSDLRVTGPNGYSVLAKFTGADSASDGWRRVANYTAAAPGGSWDSADNGTYTVTVRTRQVYDVAGNFMQTKAIGTFKVATTNTAPPPTPPSSTLVASTLTAGGNPSYLFQVVYKDTDGVKVSTLSSSDLRVTGPNGFSVLPKFVSVDINSDGWRRVATYRLDAPGGYWDKADNGTYSVAVRSGQVSDTLGTFIGNRAIGSFKVDAPYIPPPDVSGPQPTLVAADVNTGGAISYTFKVVYNDPSGVAVATLDSNDVRVQGPNGYNVLATFVSVDYNSVGNRRVGTYRIDAPGGYLDPDDNGTYTVRIRSGEVADAKGNYISDSGIGSFAVSSPALPTAVAGSLPTLLANGQTSYVFSIMFADDLAIDVSDFDTNDLIVTGPGDAQFTAIFVKSDKTDDGAIRNATYRIWGPDGTWDPEDWGQYSISMAAEQVSDTAGNYVKPGFLGKFTVVPGYLNP